jgi:hypothetical protein
MAQPTILPDDPRLTAYALDEMEPAERAEFEMQLRHDPAARAAVAEIQATSASLADALADEPLLEPAVGPLKNSAIVPGRDPRRLDGGLVSPDKLLGKKITFPQFYYLVAGLAAACFAVFFAYWDKNRPTHDVKKYIEVPFVEAKNREPVESVPVSLPAAESDVLGNTETYAFHRDSDFQKVSDNSLSTFSADVDTAAYANVRRFILAGKRPPVDAVRIEELVNYFPYDYPAPGVEAAREVGSVAGNQRAPFAAHL